MVSFVEQKCYILTWSHLSVLSFMMCFSHLVSEILPLHRAHKQVFLYLLLINVLNFAFPLFIFDSPMYLVYFFGVVLS